jgi:hypothetical protein
MPGNPIQHWRGSKPSSTKPRCAESEGIKTQNFVDSSFVKKVDDEGLPERLYKVRQRAAERALVQVAIQGRLMNSFGKFLLFGFTVIGLSAGAYGR